MAAAVAYIKDTFNDWLEDNAFRLAAALSYYAVLSLAPLVLVCVAVIGLVFGRQTVGQEVVAQVQQMIGPQGAEVVRGIIASANPYNSTIALIIGLVTLLIGATAVFVQLQDGLNVIWEVRAKPGQGLRGFIRNRLLSLVMVAAMGALLLASLLISATLHALAKYFAHLLPGQAGLAQLVDVGASLLVMTLLFALIYKLLPDVQIAWRDVWIGAVTTALLFTAGKFLLGLYLGRGGVGSAYGAAGSLIAVLVWVYYSALILFLGAEFTQVWARRHGRGFVPKEHALRVEERPVAVQGPPAEVLAPYAPRAIPGAAEARRDPRQEAPPQRPDTSQTRSPGGRAVPWPQPRDRER